MAALLRDVGDAIGATAEPSVSFAAPTMDEGPKNERGAQATAADIILNEEQVVEGPKENEDIATNVGDTREQQGGSIEVTSNVSPRSPPLYCDPPRSVTAGIWDDGPSCDLFQKGSEDYEWMHSTDENANKRSAAKPLYSTIPMFPVSDDESPIDSPAISTPTTLAENEQIVDMSSGPSTHDKNTRKKRMAKALGNKPKAKQQKVVDEVVALCEKYIMHGKTLKRAKKDELP